MPEEWGGPGLDTISYVLMLEEVAKIHAAIATALSVTNSAVQLPLLAHGTQAQKSKYLRRLAAGEILGAFCLTEPAAGSDAAGIQSTAVLQSSTSSTSSASSTSYVLNGTKTWVTNGSAAGLYLIFAKTNPAAAGKGITAFLVEPNFPGFKIGRHEDKMGQRSSPSAEILLNDCVVPAENRLGEEGAGLKIALCRSRRRPHRHCGPGRGSGTRRPRRIPEIREGPQSLQQSPSAIFKPFSGCSLTCTRKSKPPAPSSTKRRS